MNDRSTVCCTKLLRNHTEGLLMEQVAQDPAVLYMPDERLSSKSQNSHWHSADKTTAKYLNAFGDVLEKLTKDQQKCLIPNVCGSFVETTKQCEENVNNELMPLTYVDVPPFSVKNEPTDNCQNDVRCFDSNLKDPLGECSGVLNFINERNIKTECTSQSELQVKSEPKDDDNVCGVHMTEDSFLSDIVTHSCHELTSKESHPSEKSSKCELKSFNPNVCGSFVEMTNQYEEHFTNELMPLTFVAVPPLSRKIEQTEDCQNGASCFDSDLKDPLGECSGALNFINGTNIKKGCFFQSELQLKSEPKEDNNVSGVQMREEKVTHLSHEFTSKESNPLVSCHEEHGMENNECVMFGDSFCSEGFTAGETLNLEIKCESFCEIPQAHLKVQKFENNQILNDSVCNNTETLQFVPESDWLECGAQHIPVSGYQQNVNEDECDASTSKTSTSFLLEIGNETPANYETRVSVLTKMKLNMSGKKLRKRTNNETPFSYSTHDTCFNAKEQFNTQHLVQSDSSITKLRVRRIKSGSVQNNCIGKTNVESLKKVTHPKYLRNKQFQCEICKSSFLKKIQLGVHMRTHTGAKPFKCEVCEKSFSRKGRFISHRLIHTGEKPFKCDICGTSFRKISNLVTHARTHTGFKPFQCEICKNRFYQKGSLTSHMLIHTGQKPFNCDICGTSFRCKSHLQSHIRIHTGDKPFKSVQCVQCDVCKASFNSKHHLIVHFRTHSGEKPYKCKICETSFRHKHTLDGHMLTHTGEKPFCCEICKSSFTLKSNLSYHLRTHSDEKPFQCKICKSSFRFKAYLKQHLRIHTGGKHF